MKRIKYTQTYIYREICRRHHQKKNNNNQTLMLNSDLRKRKENEILKILKDKQQPQ